MKKHEINPHFHEVATSQTWVSSEGTASLSLRQTPTTQEHFNAEMQGSGRPLSSTYDIDVLRAQQPEEVARIREEYAIEHLLQQKVGDKVARQLEVRIVNNDAEGAAIGVMTSWSTDAEWENEKAIVEALALTYPNQKIVFIVTPGMGQSFKVSGFNRHQMIESGSFSLMAGEMAVCLQQSDLTFDTLVGVSEGGRVAISLGEQLGVETVVTVDPPGTDEQHILTFMKRFAIDEAKGQKAVLEHTPDTEMALAHKKVDSKLLAKQGLAAVRRDLLSRARVMAKAGLADDVKAATAKGVTIVDYRAGGSTFANSEVAVSLAKTTPGYNAVVLKDAPHGINEGSPYVILSLVQQAKYLLDSKK